MRIRCNGRHRPSQLPCQLLRWLQRLVSAFGGSIQVDVRDSGRVYSYVCTNLQTLRRATTLLIKEPGTIRWLRREAGAGKVFLDIGANVGVYSIFAAHHLGPDGHVYAVEPHLRNAAALMDNIMAGRLQERVSVLTLALGREVSVLEFRYRDWETGSSHSQLQTGEPLAEIRNAVARELKVASTIDSLVRAGILPAPDFIKIDVDGIEPAILEGASELLRGERRPGSVQVEVDPANHARIDAFMAEHGYRLLERHATKAGAKRIARGARIEDLPHNAVYEAP